LASGFYWCMEFMIVDIQNYHVFRAY